MWTPHVLDDPSRPTILVLSTQPRSSPTPHTQKKHANIWISPLPLFFLISLLYAFLHTNHMLPSRKIKKQEEIGLIKEKKDWLTNSNFMQLKALPITQLSSYIPFQSFQHLHFLFFNFFTPSTCWIYISTSAEEIIVTAFLDFCFQFFCLQDSWLASTCNS